MNIRTASSHRSFADRGFSLVESLVSATLLACFASVAIPVMVTSDDSVDATKMRHDVDCLNHLLSSYQTAGGSLDGLNSPQAVLDKLQAGLTTDAAVKYANKPSTQVYGPLSAHMQSTSEAQSHALRAVWDAKAHIFKIENGGPAGVSTFSLDPSLESHSYSDLDVASVTKPFNTSNGWIWGKTSKTTTAAALPPTQYTLVETDNRFNPAKR